MRSFDSSTVLSGSPTILKKCNPGVASTSTSIGNASSPTVAPENMRIILVCLRNQNKDLPQVLPEGALARLQCCNYYKYHTYYCQVLLVFHLYLSNAIQGFALWRAVLQIWSHLVPCRQVNPKDRKHLLATPSSRL